MEEGVPVKDVTIMAQTPRHTLPAKKRSTLSIFRAAIVALSGCSASKKDATLGSPTGADGMLKTLVGSMRPLGLPLEYRPPLPLLPPPPPAGHESFHDAYLLPSPSCSSSDGMSRYASAEDLQLLDDADDSTEADAGAPNAIDMKAEEFIARFYEQMRLQRQESSGGSNQAAA
ncbi:uncharacterized protein LOC103971441 [Musa acuminata AAA Group]|uniref:(wild Malaysian banana) hypothetical protein n=1 Tax=Musa acuminata subsp. malaccensis TaxID=214687 RepID=A0A804L743_MUSAM|nr:PREDICTED: uncharacterized protein LOC103971441 [Musa acuminata subsp. malaccensis]CAG1864383.1 unnamed protein product [Musa acuminata subsp. malaccensis]